MTGRAFDKKKSHIRITSMLYTEYMKWGIKSQQYVWINVYHIKVYNKTTKKNKNQQDWMVSSSRMKNVEQKITQIYSCYLKYFTRICTIINL